MTPTAKALLIKTRAREAGFDLVGIAHADPLSRVAYYRDWLAAGYGGTMPHLYRNVRLRSEPARLLPDARSILCVALLYKRADGYLRPGQVDPTARLAPSDAPTGRIAQYARGEDYHRVLPRLLRALVAQMRAELNDPFQYRICVDTVPLLERELAARAGLGWIGKNTCLLNGRLGSYLLLGELVTTLELPPDEPVADGCASCTRCLDICPTKALVAPYQLNASRCVSYLTIEHRGEIATELRAGVGDCLFGCDWCQQVCPYNAGAPLATHPDIARERTPPRISLHPLLHLSNGDHRRLTKATALRRARRATWQRNAALVLANLPGGSSPIALP